MKITKINEKHVLVDVPYEEHRRGKNYAAMISGLDDRFGLKRKWLEKTNLSTGRTYVFPEKPVAGEYIEIQAIYYSGGGHPAPREGSGFYEIKKDGSLVAVEKEHILKSFENIEEVSL